MELVEEIAVDSKEGNEGVVLELGSEERARSFSSVGFGTRWGGQPSTTGAGKNTNGITGVSLRDFEVRKA